MNFEEIFTLVDPVPGWMGREDCEVLYHYASGTVGTIVEIGSYRGRSARLLALSSPNSQVITIDKDSHPELRENIQGLNVDVIHATSEEAARGWNRTISLLFVDGDHSFGGVKRDLKNFLPHVRRGGLVLFHDYVVRDEGYGVREAVDKCRGVIFMNVRGGIACCVKK